MQLPGLLDQEDPNSFGLIDAMRPGGLDPISLMLRRAMGGPTDGKAGGQQVTPGASAGGAPAAPPSAAPPEPPPSPVQKDPNLSPLRTGIANAGMQLLQDSSTPTPYKQNIGSLLSRALAAGVPAFVASKQLKAQREAGLARRSEYLSMLRDPEVAKVLGPAGVRLAGNMDAEKGIEYITNLMQEQNKSSKPTVVGKSLVDPTTGAAIYRDSDPTMTVGNAVYALGPDGLPKTGEDGKPLPPVIEAGKSFDIAKIDSNTREALIVALGRDPRDAENFAAPLTPEEASKVREYSTSQRQAGADKGANVTVQAGEKAAEVAMQGGNAEGLIARKNALLDQANTYEMAGKALDLIRSGRVITGTGANFRKALGNALVTAGLAPKGVEDAVVATQQFIGNARDLTSRLVKRLGSGNGISDKDVSFMESIVGSDISNQPEAIAYLLDLQRRAIRAEAIRHNQEVGRFQGASEQAKANTMVDMSVFGGAPAADAPPAGGGNVGPAGPSVQTQFNGKTVEAKWDAALGKYIYTDSQGRKFEAAPR